ncbi:MAG: peroxidase family protein, partial [Bdellovibrionota bacterium]
IVLGGNAAIENAARKAGSRIRVPFKAGRMDASLEQTDVDSFTYLEPKADAFRNYYANGNDQSPIKMMIEKADTLDLSVPEMAVLIGGLRSLDANTNAVKHGVLTSRPGALSNDFFVNLMSMDTVWRKSATVEGLYEGFSRKDNKKKYTATPIDLVFGSHAELRAVSEAYAADDAKKKFLDDFVAAWNKVMNLDRM